MTWGSPSGRSRWGPAKLAYGGTAGPEEEQLAFEASLSAGVDLFDTAAMYSGGASERRVGELAEGRQVVIATKFPPGWHLDPFAHGVYGRRGGSGQGQGGRGEQLFRSPTPHRPRGAGRAGDPLASNQVEHSLLHRAPEVNGVLDACRELEITLIAYQPLAQRILTGKYRPGIGPRGSGASAATSEAMVSRRLSQSWRCWVRSVNAIPRLRRRWPCGGSSDRRASCQSRVRGGEGNHGSNSNRMAVQEST